MNEVSGGSVGELELEEALVPESSITTTASSPKLVEAKASQSILLFLESFGRGEQVNGSMTFGSGCACDIPAADDIAKQKLELHFGK